VEQFDKVVNGLEHCKTEDCSGCPYEDTSAPVGKFGTDELVACQPVLYSDAIALIRQQQERIKELEAGQTARVMTVEEALVDSNTEIEISPYVFVEEKGRSDIFIGSVHDDIYGGYHSDDIKIAVYRIGMRDSRIYSKRDYMKKLRFWSKRPTDEQREAEKWE